MEPREWSPPLACVNPPLPSISHGSSTGPHNSQVTRFDMTAQCSRRPALSPFCIVTDSGPKSRMSLEEEMFSFYISSIRHGEWVLRRLLEFEKVFHHRGQLGRVRAPMWLCLPRRPCSGNIEPYRALSIISAFLWQRRGSISI